MSVEGKRLRQLRESLRTADGRSADRHALCDLLGWPASRWKNLETGPPWGEDSRVWLREGLLALVARTTLPEGAGQQAVRFVMGEAKALPWSSPPTWLEGQGPVPRPVGRPALARPVVDRDVKPENVLAAAPAGRLTRAVFSAAVRRAHAHTIIGLALAGKIDQDTAADEIADLYDYYNKTDRQAPDVA